MHVPANQTNLAVCLLRTKIHEHEALIAGGPLPWGHLVSISKEHETQDGQSCQAGHCQQRAHLEWSEVCVGEALVVAVQCTGHGGG